MMRTVTIPIALLIAGAHLGCETGMSDSSSGGSLEDGLDSLANALVLQANRAIEAQRYDVAIEVLERLDDEFPGSTEATFTWGRVFFDAGRLALADSAFSKLLAEHPDHEGVRYSLGNVAFRSKQFRKALAYFRDEARRFPSPHPYQAMGLAYDRLAERDSALWAFHQAVSIDPAFAEAHAGIAEWYDTSGDVDRAVESAVEASRFDPENVRYASLKGQMLIRARRYQDGVGILIPVVHRDTLDYRAGFALGRGWQMLGNARMAEEYMAQAERSRRVMQPLEARMKQVEDAPDNTQVRRELAESLRDAGLFDQAILQYQFVETRQPANIGVKGNLATLYLSRRDTTSALRRYHEILAIDSTLVEIWINVCHIYLDRGQTDKALESLNEAKRYGPNDPRVKELDERASPQLDQ